MNIKLINALNASNNGISDDNAILFMFLAIIVSLLLIVFLYFRIKRGRKISATNEISSLLETEAEFEQRVKVKLSNHHGLKYYILHIEIDRGEKLKEAFGELQYNNAIKILTKRYERIFSKDFEMCEVDDENFYLAVKGNMTDRQICDYANFILLETRSPIVLAGGLKLELSVNIAICSSEFSSDYQKIKAKLQTAMIVCKRKGFNQYVIYGESMENVESEEFKQYLEIKQAIEKNEFTLYYQKMVFLKNLQVYGYEGLLRWNHKTLGVLSPQKFLETLEQSGDMNWVGTWGFEKILLLAEKLKVKYPKEHIMLSYNLSTQQLLYPRLIEDYRKVMRNIRIDNSDVCFEVEQSTLQENHSKITENLQALKNLGYSIAIDNLTVERFNLAVLENIQIDIIKIHNTFISRAMQEEMATQLLNVLLNFCKKKNITTIASGLESEEMMEFANEKGIDVGQGYLFAKPKSAEEL